MAGQQAGCIEAGLLPALCGIAVAGTLQFPDHGTTAVQQFHGEEIFTGTHPARSLTIPPVADGDVRGAVRNGVVLPDGISAAAVAAQVGAVLATVWVRRVDEFVTTRGRLHPGAGAILKPAILDQ